MSGTSCKGCAYAWRPDQKRALWYCTYILYTGMRRPCPPGEGCTERREAGERPGGRGPDITIRRTKKMGKIDNERAMKLYRDGASDSELATILGVSVSAVGQWRGKTGLKRNAAKRAGESLPQPAAPAAPSSERERALGGGVSPSAGYAGSSLVRGSLGGGSNGRRGGKRRDERDGEKAGAGGENFGICGTKNQSNR